MRTLNDVIEQMKREVIDDVQSLRVPVDVKNFGELHDFTDANFYGGLCDDDGIIDQLIAHHGGRDENEGMPEPVIVFINEAQSAVSRWIENGGVTRAIDNSDWTQNFTPYAFGDQIRRIKQLERHIDKMRHLAGVFTSYLGVVE